ncbi:hypothetical protein FXO38_15644 [Capsicum annuum]|nr:hypothetical protein FXO38_15644 [Capsicum annuum]KAF3673629.1 hypothetical protein FXO37_06863 [Capsicum annuum]
MDYPSSFSLVITQLDSNEKDITLGFVTGTFDEQDPKFAENRSKHRNDPVTMKKLRDKAASKSKKFSSKSSKKKFDDSVRPRLPKQDNKDELHVWVQGKILNFTMLEFAIITGLKCTGNIDDYMYTSSSKSELKSKYFPDNKGEITRSKLITRMKMKKFDNAEDALNLVILFFVHTFMFSQHKEAPISVLHFQMIEDGRYITFHGGSTIPPQKILIKVGLALPESPEQPLKRRKTVIFHETQKNAADKGQIGVSFQSYQHKSVPSSSTQPGLDGDEIKNYINQCIIRVIKEERIDEQQQSQEDG